MRLICNNYIATTMATSVSKYNHRLNDRVMPLAVLQQRYIVHDAPVGDLKLADIERGFENTPVHVLCIQVHGLDRDLRGSPCIQKDKSKSVHPSSSVYS
jgi:hypothetical protein